MILNLPFRAGIFCARIPRALPWADVRRTVGAGADMERVVGNGKTPNHFPGQGPELC